MVFPPLRRSTALHQQVLLSGRIEDSLSEAPISPLTLQVYVNHELQGQDIPDHLRTKVLPDGRFAVSGIPSRVFPKIGEQSYELRLEIFAEGYEGSSLQFSVDSLVDQPENVSLQIGNIPEILLRRFSQDVMFTDVGSGSISGLPITDIVIPIEREPVFLSGRVMTVEAVGIQSAAVSILDNADSVSTDSQGFFAFTHPMPVKRAIALEIMAEGYESLAIDAYELNYSQPQNQLQSILVPETPDL